MRLGSPLEPLHQALAAAAHRDLPDIEYEDRDWDSWRKLSAQEQAESMRSNKVPVVSRVRRPLMDELKVVMFSQVWGSTALGYGGMGGAAVTPAYTVVVEFKGVWCVYFGHGVLAYKLEAQNMSDQGLREFKNDLRDQKLVAVGHMQKYL